MGQVLYRKHRPKKLAEVVGQEHITKTLTEALKQGRISHAYLFTGPRGVGKTSIARILAHELNDLSYTDDSAHIDIIEIDAASNRRIDEIRELRDKVHVAPASATYKVYIIDEVHMLTREAFNALLKTLEEPPAHVVFILATTDTHKLPETIVSRTQRYNFKPVARDAVVKHLSGIAKQEKLKVDSEALELLAEHGEGSFRDSISLLDQASSHGQQVSADEVRRLLGVPPEDAVEGLARTLASGSDAASALGQLVGLYDQGYQAAAIAKQLAQRLRRQLVEGASAIPADQILGLLHRLIEVPTSRDPDRFLEIVLLENISMPSVEQTHRVTESSTTRQAEPEPEVTPPLDPAVDATRDEVPPVKTTGEESTLSQAVEKPTLKSAPAAQRTAEPVDGPLDAAIWPEVLAALKQKHNTLYGVVRMAQPRFKDDGSIELAFAFAFHQKRLSEAGNRQKLVSTVEGVTGHTVTIECVLDPATAKPTVETPIAPDDSGDLATVSNIFGGGELLES